MIVPSNQQPHQRPGTAPVGGQPIQAQQPDPRRAQACRPATTAAVVNQDGSGASATTDPAGPPRGR